MYRTQILMNAIDRTKAQMRAEGHYDRNYHKCRLRDAINALVAWANQNLLTTARKLRPPFANGQILESKCNRQAVADVPPAPRQQFRGNYADCRTSIHNDR
jgi:hypothetical protein